MAISLNVCILVISFTTAKGLRCLIKSVDEFTQFTVGGEFAATFDHARDCHRVLPEVASLAIGVSHIIKVHLRSKVSIDKERRQRVSV